MGLLIVNNSHSYLEFTHFQSFFCASTHPTYNSTNRTTSNIFIFVYTCSTCITTGTKTTSNIFIFICIHNTSITTTIRTNSSTKTTTNIFIFICICGTSISTSTFATSLITKLAFTIHYFLRVCTMICPPALYLSPILPHSSVIEILRRLSMVLSTDVMGRVKTMSFGIMFNQSIVSLFKVLYLERKSNCQITLCITKL